MEVYLFLTTIFFSSFGAKHVTPRSLSAHFIGNMVCVEGIVTKCKSSTVKCIVWRGVSRHNTFLSFGFCHMLTANEQFPCSVVLFFNLTTCIFLWPCTPTLVHFLTLTF